MWDSGQLVKVTGRCLIINVSCYGIWGEVEMLFYHHVKYCHRGKVK